MEHASYSFEAFARALVYIPAILFLGSISYRWTYLESEQEAKWLRRLALWAASVIVLAIGLRSLAHDYAAFGEDAWSWESLRLIVIESRWGQRWRWQFVAAVASVMSLALVYVAPKLGWVLTSLSGLGLCFSLPLTGHAMVLGTTTIILQAAHVAGAGIWMGTLSVLFLAFRRDPTPERFRKLAPIATTGALLVGVSGTVTAWHALPDLASLWQSAWGRLLAAKLALVVGIGGCGFFNWRHFRAPEPKGSYADGRIEDTGPLTKKRMETVDEEFLEAALGFIDQTHARNEPFFLWFNSTRMHIWTYLKPESDGVTGQGIYADGMVEHDGHVGQLLDKLDELGITDNTIVMYSTDNGAEIMSWPDGGMIPFRGEKNTTWEGGFRVPMMVRWPGKIEAGAISNEIISMTDWLPTLATVGGEPDIKEKLLRGHTLGDKNFKVHLDGYNFLPYMTGEEASGPRDEFFYFTDDGSLSALRYRDWKVLFTIQEAHGFEVWVRPFTTLRVPRLFNLRRDPFERADHDSDFYTKFFIDHMFVMVPAQAVVAEFLQTFQEFPPRQKPASFTIDQVLEKLAPPSN